MVLDWYHTGTPNLKGVFHVCSKR